MAALIELKFGEKVVSFHRKVTSGRQLVMAISNIKESVTFTLLYYKPRRRL